MDLIEKHELKEVWKIIDALQLRTESSIYSKDSPESDHSDYLRDGAEQHLLRCFGVREITNKTMDKILKEVHANYMGLCRELLVVE